MELRSLLAYRNTYSKNPLHGITPTLITVEISPANAGFQALKQSSNHRPELWFVQLVNGAVIVDRGKLVFSFCCCSERKSAHVDC